MLSYHDKVFRAPNGCAPSMVATEHFFDRDEFIRACGTDPSLLDGPLLRVAVVRLLELDAAGRMEEVLNRSDGVDLGSSVTRVLLESFVDAWLDRHGYHKVRDLDVVSHVVESLEEAGSEQSEHRLFRAGKELLNVREKRRTKLRREAEGLAAVVSSLRDERDRLQKELTVLKQESMKALASVAESTERMLSEGRKECRRERDSARAEIDRLQEEIAQLRTVKGRLLEEDPELVAGLAERDESIERRARVSAELLVDAARKVFTCPVDFRDDSVTVSRRDVLRALVRTPGFWLGLIEPVVREASDVESRWGVTQRILFFRLTSAAVGRELGHANPLQLSRDSMDYWVDEAGQESKTRAAQALRDTLLSEERLTPDRLETLLELFDFEKVLQT